MKRDIDLSQPKKKYEFIPLSKLHV
jgi:hypothetical protein